MLHQESEYQQENGMKRTRYISCGVVKDIPDFRKIMASRHINLAAGEIVARYRPGGRSRPIRKITDLFPLLTEAKRKSRKKANGKKLFIYRRV